MTTILTEEGNAPPQLDAYSCSENSGAKTKKTKTSWPSIRVRLHNMIVEGATNSELSNHFKVSERTIRAWKRTLSGELLANQDFDSLEWLSKRISTFKMLRTEAWKNYDRAKTESQRLRWFSEILKAETELNNLLISSGALDDEPLSPSNLLKYKTLDHAKEN